MRYEIKYAVDELCKEHIVSEILKHPASFSKAFPDRKVNNIYMDTRQFHCYHQNIEGAPRRSKMRIRWYGEDALPMTKSTLEIKHKDKELGWKDNYPLQFEVRDENDIDRAVRSQGNLSSDLIPVLNNTYHRSYYISFDGLFRITIDDRQTFKIPFTNQLHIPTVSNSIIVELKYDEVYSDLSKFVLDYLPFRQTKNSKYTNGVTALYF